MNEINQIINKLFQTDLGYKYILNKIRTIMPYLKINEKNLENFTVQKIDYEYCVLNNFIGEYIAKENTIKIFLDLQDLGIDEKDIVEIFTHEFIHLLTSKYTQKGTLIEGLNTRNNEKTDSIFLGLNEGITQMIAEDILNAKKINAYPFQTNISRKLSLIIGKERLIELYSKHDTKGLMQEITKIDNTIDVEAFIKQVNSLHTFTSGADDIEMKGIGTQIEQTLIDLYIKSGIQKDEDFSKLIIDEDTARNLAKLVPNWIYSGPDYLYYGIYPDKNSILSTQSRKTK